MGIINLSLKKRRMIWGIFFISPALIFFVVFNSFPMFNAFYTSLFAYDLITKEFISIKNSQENISEHFKMFEFWMPKLQNVNVAQCLFATSIDRQGTVVKAKEGIAVLTKYLQAIADESKEVMKPEINNSIKEK